MRADVGFELIEQFAGNPQASEGQGAGNLPAAPDEPYMANPLAAESCQVQAEHTQVMLRLDTQKFAADFMRRPRRPANVG